jgi:hypothetical protein
VKLFFEKVRSRAQIRTLVALGLGSISLLVLLVAFQLNFQHNQLYTQVVTHNAAGGQEMMIFRDYRDQQVDQVKKMLSDCLERNEIFGDGTGDICQIHRDQLSCVSGSGDQKESAQCFQ